MNKLLLSNIKNYLTGNIIIWGLLLFYLSNKYYKNFLDSDAKDILFYFTIIYSIVISIYSLSRKEIYESKSTIIINTILKIFKSLFKNEKINVNNIEKKEVLFFGVKAFFFPLLTNFLVGNYKLLVEYISNWGKNDYKISVDIFNSNIYFIIIMTIFTIDVLFFLLAYIFESKRLDNTVKSVEPTALGWIVALFCYPPFFDNPNYYLSWYPETYTHFQSKYIAFLINLILLSTWMVYLWATIALGFKCANLCNRGITKKGPYKYIRHPAYTFKNISWWILTIPVLTKGTLLQAIILIINAFFWSFIYYLRAYTEERHLKSDPEYIKYMEEVPDRFIYGYNKFKNKYLLRNNTTKP